MRWGAYRRRYRGGGGSRPTVGVDNVAIPVVGECDDSWLSEARVVQVEAEDAGRAVARRRPRRGDRRRCRRRHGDDDEGLQSRDRHVQPARTEHRGRGRVLVLSNFYPPPGLVVDGVPVGDLLGEPPPPRRVGAGSCIVVVAVDAPISHHQLERVARRAGLGLARCGSVAHHGSGEIFIAFAPSGRRPRGEALGQPVPDRDLNDVFQAVADATEESVLNALWAAPEVTGREGRIARALPHDDVLELLDAHGRLAR